MIKVTSVKQTVIAVYCIFEFIITYLSRENSLIGNISSFPIAICDNHMNVNEKDQVPSAPNESVIIGQVVSIVKHGGQGNQWEVLVETCNAAKGKNNLAKRYIGKLLTVTVAPDLATVISKNDRIKARITYQGDGKNGTFLLVNDEIEIFPEIINKKD